MKQLASAFVAFLLLLTGNAAHAQTDRGLFWKVEKDGRTSYLLGTVHAWKHEWLPLNPTIEKAFAQATTLAVEADIARIDAFAAVQRMMLQGDETLEGRLGKSLYERTKAETARLGIPEAAINKFKPWGVMMVLAATQMQQLGYTPEAGIDAYFTQKARASNKSVIELESAEQQLALLDSFSARLQAALLEEFLGGAERAPQAVDGIVTAWKKGDVAALLALNQKGFSDSEVKREFDDKFLYQRDVAMTRKIDELLRRPGSHFIAVGSLHLVGPRSIVEQLKTRGYKVDQI